MFLDEKEGNFIKSNLNFINIFSYLSLNLAQYVNQLHLILCSTIFQKIFFILRNEKTLRLI